VRDRRVVWLVVSGVAASIVGVILALLIDWFPTQASTQADDIDTLYDVLLIASVPIFVLVVTVVLGSVVFFRMRPGQENEDGPPIHGNTRLEVIWTALPAALIAGLCAYSYVVLLDIEEEPAKAAQQELKVSVYGEQFAWTYEYPRELTGGKELITNQLYLPVDRSVEFSIRAKDVIHDFWVPAFRIKLDAVPGITTHYRVTPNRRGSFEVVCAELCGLGHATMRNRVNVVTQEEFDQWLQEQTQPAVEEGASPAEQAAAGKTVFTDTGCGGCHALADAGTTGQTGPDLDEVLQGKDADFIRESIVDPNAEIASGFSQGIMPENYESQLDETELDALVAYLEEVAG
jgi:cytochrome c oxidase subunit 2